MIDDNKIRPAWMLPAWDDIQHPRHADAQAGLLHTFARGCLGRILTAVDETGWQSPVTTERLIHPAHQQDKAFPFDQHSRRHLWIYKMDPAAYRTDRAQLSKA